MKVLSNVKRFLFAGSGTTSASGDLGLLALRLGFGAYLAFAHGMGKFPVTEGFIGAVRSMGLPMPEVMAYLAAISELAGGILLALGLLTRPAAFAVISTMGVAAFMMHGKDPFSAQGGPSKEMALLYLIAAVGILFTGAGRFSLDALISKPSGTSSDVS